MNISQKVKISLYVIVIAASFIISASAYNHIPSGFVFWVGLNFLLIFVPILILNYRKKDSLILDILMILFIFVTILTHLAKIHLIGGGLEFEYQFLFFPVLTIGAILFELEK